MKKHAHLTVFIHGSIFSGLSLINLKESLRDSLSPRGLYTRFIKEIRNNNILEHEQLIFKLGIHSIEQSILTNFFEETLTESERLQAGNILIACYNQFNKLSFSSTDTTFLYKAYGHLGLLSQKYRKQAAQELYNWFLLYYKELRTEYEKITVDFVGHSHAAGIILNLATYHDHSLDRDQAIVIDNVMLYGSPIQPETAGFSNSTLFKRIINVYSEGDLVQQVDWISTKRWKSFNKFHTSKLGVNFQNKEKIVDVRVIINDNRFAVNHVNMWHLGRSSPACKNLDPLPIFILTPVIFSLLDKNSEDESKNNQRDLIITDKIEHLELTLKLNKDSNPNNVEDNRSENFYVQSKILQELVKKQWINLDPSRNIIFNKKNLIVLTEAFKKIVFKN